MLPERAEGKNPTGKGRALVLGGGGFLGAMYEVGVLTAFEAALPGGLPDFDLYVGTSGGSVVAALLAAGHRPAQLREMISAFAPRDLCRVDLGILLKAAGRLPVRLVTQGLSGSLLRGGLPFGLLRLLQESAPGAFLSLEPLAAFLHARLLAEGLGDSFGSLPYPLFVPALDLDTGERVVFGEPGHPAVAVSRAVAASCAIPRFFRPVSWAGRDMIDGGIADALNLDVALRKGADEIVVVNPLVAPLNDRQIRCLPSPNGGCGHVADQGLICSLGQAMKISHAISTDISLRLSRNTHPRVRIDVIQPGRLEADLDGPMDFSRRAHLLALGEADGARFAAQWLARGTNPARPARLMTGVA